MKYFFRRLLSDDSVTGAYVTAGAEFGYDVSYLMAGKFFGFEKRLQNWQRWEQEYAKRGFRTISLDDFIRIGGYGDSSDELEGVRREKNEKPVFHAAIYNDNYLHVDPDDLYTVDDIHETGVPMMPVAITGTYKLPSTEHPVKIEKNA